MSFDYDQSIWADRVATLSPFDPAAIRLRRSVRALRFLKPGAKVLEVGCGGGQFIRGLKKIRPDLQCFGCDISASALARARLGGDDVEYKQNTESGLPFGDNFFEAVLVYDVLEHVLEPDKILQEINRVLKPAGLFYLYVPAEGDWLSFWHYLRHFKRWRNLTENYAGHINHWSRRVWVGLIVQSRFKLISSSYSEHFFGQTINVLSFVLMNRFAHKHNLKQLNNESFFSDSGLGKIVFLKKAVNFIMYWEARLLWFLPSPNCHSVWKK